jgi:glycosyltransferase involved in cell wall biosynthesis
MPVKANVTVVLPCFNGSAFLREAVESVVLQTYLRWSLILVDDGSTDSTGEIMAGIKNQLGSAVTILTGENKGACFSRNWAISNAKTEYVAFLDADDLWHPGKLLSQISVLEGNSDIGGLTCGYRMLDSKSGRLTQELNFFWTQSEIRNWTLLGSHAPGLNSTLVARLDLVLKAGGYDEDLNSHADDLDLAWRLRDAGRVTAVPETLATLRVSDGQIHRDFLGMARSLSIFYKKIDSFDAELAEQGKSSLELQVGIRELAGKQSLEGLGRIAKIIFSSPVVSCMFAARKLIGKYRLAFRVAGGA